MNKIGFRLASVVFFAALLSVSSCKKKGRLSASTFDFKVTPTASTVLKNTTLTLTASAGTLDINPTWSITSGPGTITPDIGRQVVFTSTALGDTRISTTYDGVTVVTQVAIVTYIPNSNTFDVYRDAGLPTGFDSDIFDPSSLLTELSSGYTTEGVKYEHAANTQGGNFWGITLDKSPDTGIRKDLSAFSAGSLKFSLRLARAMGGAETLKVEVTDSAAPVSFTLVSGSNGFNRTDTDWQEISIPATSFTGSGLDLSTIKNPFALITFSVSSALSYDVDAVRWEK